MFVLMRLGLSAEGPLAELATVGDVVDDLAFRSCNGVDLSEIIVYMPGGKQMDGYDFMDQYSDEPLI